MSADLRADRERRMRAQSDIALIKATRRAGDLRRQMSTAEGRRFVFSLLEATGYMGEGWSKDARETDFLQGRRSIGCALARELVSVDAATYQAMQSEAINVSGE